MGLKIHSVNNSKSVQGEFIWIKVTENVNIEGYAIVDRAFNGEENLSNQFRHIYVFPSLDVDKDDWVRLWTGKGNYRKMKVPDDEGFMHDLYWGSEHCVWNDSGEDIATLIKYSVVNSIRAKRRV